MTSRVMLLLCLVASCVAQAKQEISAADEKLMAGYTLSMDKLHRYATAVAKMDAACRNDPAIREESDQAAPKAGATLEQAVRQVGEASIFKRFMKTARLDAQDVVLMPIVLMGAGAVVEAHADLSKLHGLTDAQVAFYRAHRDEIGKLKLSGECEDDQ